MSDPAGPSKRAREQLSAPTYVKMRRLEELISRNDTDQQYFIITAVSDKGIEAQALDNGTPNTSACVLESYSDDEQIENSESIDSCKEDEVIVKSEKVYSEDPLDVMDEPEIQSEIITDPGSASLVIVKDIATNKEPLQIEPVVTMPGKPSVASQGLSKEKVPRTLSISMKCMKYTDIGPWVADDSSMRNINFTRKQSWLKPPVKDPVKYFEYFIEDDYLREIVVATNHNAFERKDRKAEFIYLRNWTDVTVAELKIFFGLLLHTGTAKLKFLGDYWRQHRLYKSCFTDYMTPQRFTAILQYFTFPNSETFRKHCYALNHPMADHFNDVMESIYYPGRNLSVSVKKNYFDVEQKFPVKVIMLHKHDGPIVKIVFDPRRVATKDAETIMLQLLEDKMDAGHSVYVDEELTTITPMVARAFLRSNTYCTGILDHTRVEVPANLVNAHVENGQCKSLFFEGLHIGKHESASGATFFVTSEFKKETQTKETNSLPETLRVFNEMKKDPHDDIFNYWPCGLNKLPIHKKLFVYTLLVGTLNANRLCNMFSNTKYNYHAYRLMVIERLLPAIPEVPRTSIRTISSHRLVKIGKCTSRRIGENKTVKATSRRDCKNCMLVMRRRNNTIYQCCGCDGFPAFCLECFFAVHTCDSL